MTDDTRTHGPNPSYARLLEENTELLEALAESEHVQWAHWTEYMLDYLTEHDAQFQPAAEADGAQPAALKAAGAGVRIGVQTGAARQQSHRIGRISQGRISISAAPNGNETKWCRYQSVEPVREGGRMPIVLSFGSTRSPGVA